MISKFYILVSVLLAGIAIIYIKPSKSVQLFTKELLSQFDGIKRKELYLSILGDVYDVSKAKQNYGPGQSYHIFTGRDASRSFITGEFKTADASDDVTDLPAADLLSLRQWQLFYAKQYEFKGKLIGKYYDDNGNPTKYLLIVEELIKIALMSKDDTNADEQQYPPCNVEWDAETGTRVWCSNRSGGILRDWTGYPRRYYKPGSKSSRCACIQEAEFTKSKFEQYENCNVYSVSCNVNS